MPNVIPRPSPITFECCSHADIKWGLSECAMAFSVCTKLHGRGPGNEAAVIYIWLHNVIIEAVQIARVLYGKYSLS